MRKINRIVIHVSDSPDDKEFDVHDIAQWHRQRGFNGIGYHAIVQRNGIIEDGRDHNKKGAHVYGHNDDSLGICWIGRNFIGHFQYMSLLSEVCKWCLKYGLSAKDVYGHSELDPNKTCPNIDMHYFRSDITKELSAIHP